MAEAVMKVEAPVELSIDDGEETEISVSSSKEDWANHGTLDRLNSTISHICASLFT
jgi:hypothetical protein